MSSIGVVVFRNPSLGKAQVLQESVNNSVNITNNDQNVRREIIIVRKKQKIPPSPTVSVSSLVNSSEPITTVPAKRQRIRENGTEEAKTPTPLAVARRNARERNRVRQVNDGFAALRRHIPEEVAAAFESANSNRGPNKKLSKVETLRMAVEYIRNLEALLNIGHANKENANRTSMESFPSPASSSPRENSQERSYFTLNSPAIDDDDIDEDELDGPLNQLSHQQYMDIPASENFQLVSTPHLYEEEEGIVQPMTPSSDLLQEDVAQHLLSGHFPFSHTAEQFTVISEQNYCNETEVTVADDFEVKYSDSVSDQIHSNYDANVLPLEAINAEMILSNEDYKFKEENNAFIDNEHYSEEELKKELPEIQMTPEDKEHIEETLKWWQEKTRQSRPLKNIKNN